jgi:hypothetical protein
MCDSDCSCDGGTTGSFGSSGRGSGWQLIRQRFLSLFGAADNNVSDSKDALSSALMDLSEDLMAQVRRVLIVFLPEVRQEVPPVIRWLSQSAGIAECTLFMNRSIACAYRRSCASTAGHTECDLMFTDLIHVVKVG